MPEENREICLTWLAASGLSPDHLRDLFSEEPDPIRIFARFESTGELFSDRKLPPSLVRSLRDGASERTRDRWNRNLTRYGIQVMCCLDACWPKSLLNLPEAPAILFYRGNPSAAASRSVSMVGSRNASARGLEAAGKIAEKLSRAGISVVSGLAYGIDAAAHRGCLKGGSPTIAVLGCGLDQDYPAENAPLRRQILENGGLLLSEYIPGEKPLGWHFPYRNRIISGLGDALVLMEARIRSGSMTTVQHALNQGKDVFVYPGEPGNPRNEGNHQLLREGAIYFTTAEDLMEDMGWLDKTADVGQNIESAEPTPPVSASEKQVLDQLDRGEMSFEELCDALNMPAAMLNATLSMLQIQGLIRALPGKRYEKSLQD